MAGGSSLVLELAGQQDTQEYFIDIFYASFFVFKAGYSYGLNSKIFHRQLLWALLDLGDIFTRGLDRWVPLYHLFTGPSEDDDPPSSAPGGRQPAYRDQHP